MLNTSWSRDITHVSLEPINIDCITHLQMTFQLTGFEGKHKTTVSHR